MGLCGGGVRMRGAVGEWGEDGAGGCQIYIAGSVGWGGLGGCGGCDLVQGAS